MKKTILAAAMIVSLLLPALPTAQAYDQNGAQTYLEAHNNSPWTVMALSALGAGSVPADFLKSVNATSAIQYEAPILAITSIGGDPRSFSSTDLVAGLKSFHTDGQLGDPATLNDDVFGVLALNSAGVPQSDPVIMDSKNFLLAHQNSDGGWGFTVGSTSDTNTTATAILALLASGVASTDSHIQNAAAYLHAAQNDDGGFPYDPHSSFGTSSDTSSTAWVTWALDALAISPATWSKAGHSPVDYLNSTQTPSGFFEFQPGSGEDAFSRVTTSYAVIALTGGKLPLRIFSGTTSPGQFDFRIEGSAGQVCAGKTAGPTALDIVKNASAMCGFTYHISDTSFGPYLDQINSDKASGQTGWLYLVNDVAASVGAADFTLQTGDSVLWFFGDFDWQPTRLRLSSGQISSGGSTTATLEAFNNGSWSALAGGTITYGSGTGTTDANGQAVLQPADGTYQVFGSKTGFVRSNRILLQVGQSTNANVSLQADIEPGQVRGSRIAFTVEPGSLDFGTLHPGDSGDKSVTIANTGTVPVNIEATVSGDPLFSDNLDLAAAPWPNFRLNLDTNASQDTSISLTVPAEFAQTGPQTGQITFWAQAQ